MGLTESMAMTPAASVSGFISRTRMRRTSTSGASVLDQPGRLGAALRPEDDDAKRALAPALVELAGGVHAWSAFAARRPRRYMPLLWLQGSKSHAPSRTRSAF